MAFTNQNKRLVHFVTPENIEVTYELAGIGSRFVAALIDHTVQALLCLIVWIGASQVSNLFSIGGIGSAPFWAQAVAAISIFVILFGYYVFCELSTGGQSIGKRIARLRVVRDGGYPIDLYSSVIRNLVRVVDILVPPPYGAGIVCIFFSREYKRLGDFAAGTVVIKERASAELPTLASPGTLVTQLMAIVTNIDALTPEEHAAVRRFVERRAELPYPLQIDFAMRIALPMLTKLGVTVAIAHQSHYPDLIEAIDRLYTESKGLGIALSPDTDYDSDLVN